MHNRVASDPANQMAPHFPWNMLNGGIPKAGASYFDSWEIVKDIGCASAKDFNSNNSAKKWMTGYSKYYRAMQNKIDEVYAIDVGSPEGLLSLKHWLYDHGDGRNNGGLANFQIGSGGMVLDTLATGTEDAGKLILTRFGTHVGHAMTFVGYNDSVRHDVNGDGRYTNDVDITYDGVIDLRDWEIGALVCVNTYGINWANSGKVYVPYRLIAEPPLRGGVWNQSVMVVKPRKDYKPPLTLRLSLKYPKRNQLRITAGVSDNPNASEPDHILDLAAFRFQGGSNPMQGNGTSSADEIEIGLDVSELLNYITPGQEAAFFLIIDEQDASNQYAGYIEYFSFIDNNSGEEVYYNDYYMNFKNMGRVSYKVRHTPEYFPPVIETNSLPASYVGQDYQYALQASGGVPPYRWEQIGHYYVEEKITTDFPMITDDIILPIIGNNTAKRIVLPFEFPLFGDKYKEFKLLTDGALVVSDNWIEYPYAIDNRLMLQQNIGIFPFFADLVLPHHEDWIYYQADDEKAIFRWNASYYESIRWVDVNFASILYKNGDIEFYYGYFANQKRIPANIALAGGTAGKFHYSALNMNGFEEGSAVRFRYSGGPPGLKINDEGLLYGLPDEAGTWNIPFRVIDNNGLTTVKTLTFNVGSTGVENKATELSEVKIYPQPAEGCFWLDLKNMEAGNLTIQLFDMVGREIYTYSQAVPGGDNIIEISIPDVDTGTYLLKTSGVHLGIQKLIVR